MNHLLSLADQQLLDERVSNCAPLVIFSRKVAADTQCTSVVLQKMDGFHQWDIGPVIIVSPHLVIISDSTHIYLHESLQDSCHDLTHQGHQRLLNFGFLFFWIDIFHHRVQSTSQLFHWHSIPMLWLCSFPALLPSHSLPAGDHCIEPGYYGCVTKPVCRPQQCHHCKLIGLEKERPPIGCHWLCSGGCNEICCYVISIVVDLVLTEATHQNSTARLHNLKEPPVDCWPQPYTRRCWLSSWLLHTRLQTALVLFPRGNPLSFVQDTE